MKTKKLLFIVFILSIICVSNVFADDPRSASWNGYPYPNPIDAGGTLHVSLNFYYSRVVRQYTYGELVGVTFYIYNSSGQEATRVIGWRNVMLSPYTFDVPIPSNFASGTCYIRPEVTFFTYTPTGHYFYEAYHQTLSTKSFTILN